MEKNTHEECAVLQIKDIFEEWHNNARSERVAKISEKIKLYLHLEDCSEEVDSFLQEESRLFSLNIERYWKQCNRHKNSFMQHHAIWLEQNFDFRKIKSQLKLYVKPQQESKACRGRPRKPFEEASTKTKKRRVQELLHKSSEELRFAAQRAEQGPSSTTKAEHSGAKVLPVKQALALCLDLNLSVRKYNILRSVVNALHKDCFPSYNKLAQVKQHLLPSNITATEISAEINLQELLEKTVDGILNILKFEIGSDMNLKLICKWGFDGSSGHSLYKQKFQNSNDNVTDEFLFLIAFVPLKLINENSGDCIWQNERSSSTHFCRPIKFIFSKENAELVRTEDNNINKIINALRFYNTSYKNYNLAVSFQMIFTMFDGSVANVLSGTNSTAKCFVCGASPREMNQDNIVNRPSNTDNYRFGISSLHCWIRFFECLLHIAYRLPLKCWQVRGDDKKQIFEHTKKRIQSEFKSKLGLIVDKPKPGYGSTNDGNTARRFFSNPDISAEITGVNREIIVNFAIILRVIASGFIINTTTFSTLLNNTRQMYLNLYSWYYMPSSVHKVLVHGCTSTKIEFFDLPIGQLSEEALEGRHKEIRKIRLYHARKSSRTNTNIDVIRGLVLTSDPELSTLRKVSSNKNYRNENDIKPYIVLNENSVSGESIEESFPLELVENINIEDESDYSSESD